MRVEFNRTGAERKALVTAIGEILGTKPKYKGMPTAAYDFGGLIIDKNGDASSRRTSFQRISKTFFSNLPTEDLLTKAREYPKTRKKCHRAKMRVLQWQFPLRMLEFVTLQIYLMQKES